MQTKPSAHALFMLVKYKYNRFWFYWVWICPRALLCLSLKDSEYRLWLGSRKCKCVYLCQQKLSLLSHWVCFDDESGALFQVVLQTVCHSCIDANVSIVCYDSAHCAANGCIFRDIKGVKLWGETKHSQCHIHTLKLRLHLLQHRSSDLEFKTLAFMRSGAHFRTVFGLDKQNVWPLNVCLKFN